MWQSQIHRFLLVTALLGGTASSALAQQYKLTWPTKLDGDPPDIFDQDNGNPPGRVKNLTYNASVEIPPKSTLKSVSRPVVVYTPPGYTKTKSYPVLYLLHGWGGNQTDWTTKGEGQAQFILDNLLASGKIVPMIVVMPDNNASTASTQTTAQTHASYRLFESELLEDLIPFIDEKYSTIRSADGRALAGLSEGAEQALKFGLENLNTFSYIGAFSPGADLMEGVKADPTRKNLFVPADPIPNISNLRLFWLSCGNDDPTHLPVCPELVDGGLNVSSSFIKALNASLSYLVKSISWGNGSGVPSKGKSLILVGTDNDDLLHIRIFNGSGKLVTDTNESLLPDSRAFEIMVLKEYLTTYGVGHVFTDNETIQVITEVSSIVSDPIPVLNADLRLYQGMHEWSVWRSSLYYFLEDLSRDEPVY